MFADTIRLIGDHLFVLGRNATRLDVYALPTGRLLWRQSAGFVTALAQDVDGATLLAPADPSAAGQVRLVDVRTGAVRWSRATTESTSFAAVGPDRFLQRSPAGDARVVEVSTGRVLASGTLGTPGLLTGKGPQAGPAGIPAVSVVDGQVFLLYQFGDPNLLAA